MTLIYFYFTVNIQDWLLSKFCETTGPWWKITEFEHFEIC